MIKTENGVKALNIRLQNALNPNGSPEISRFGTIYRRGDKVMQVVNNYSRGVFNGDIGFIEHIDTDEKLVVVMFYDTPVTYPFAELDELMLAYALSGHKSQGSEMPCVVIPITNQHYVMLHRNLLYTAVTRGKRQVILVGDIEALKHAVRDNGTKHRWTSLAGRLKGDFK